MGAALSRNDSYGTQDVPNNAAPGLTSDLVDLGLNIVGTPYTDFDNGFVSAIVGAAFLSALSVVLLLGIHFTSPKSRLGEHTHIMAIFGSLLAANFLQAMGTLLNTKWVLQGGVTPGSFCSFQGGLKQAGNVASAVWSFALALHAFCLLFLRIGVSKRGKWLALLAGWGGILFIIVIGPTAIHKKEHGPYYGPSGFWCWITDEYPGAQTFLEYFFEWMSAFFSFLLYVAVLLRVRGNLIRSTAGKWSLRWVPRSERWQLSIGRDYLDTAMMKMAAVIVWFPVAYTILIVPITLARFAEFGGLHVPQALLFLADMIFGLGGFTNLMLFLATRHRVPDLDTLPELTMQRERLDKNSTAAIGITPFVLTQGDLEKGSANESPAADVRSATGGAPVLPTGTRFATGDGSGEVSEKPHGEERQSAGNRVSVGSSYSVASAASYESTEPLTGRH